MASLTDRMIRAAKLDVSLYEEVEADKGAMGQAMGVVIQEVEADKGAMGQAMGVVILSSVAAGIGTIDPIGIKGFF